MVTIDVTDGALTSSMTFAWNVDPARGTWIDYTDDSNTLSVTDDSDEKDIAVGDLNKDGWDDIIIVRKAPFMETEARTRPASHERVGYSCGSNGRLRTWLCD